MPKEAFMTDPSRRRCCGAPGWALEPGRSLIVGLLSLVISRVLLVVPLVGLLVCASGCAGYKLGPSNGLHAGDKSIQINPVINSTLEPRLGAALNQALRKEIQRDGTYRLSTRGDGDVVVNTEIVRYYRREMAFQPRDTLSAQDYELNVYARVVATDQRLGKEVMNKEVRGRVIIRIGTDLVSAERQNLPLLAENFAENVTSLLVDGEW